MALEAVGSIAVGLARLIGYDNPGGEDQSDLIVALFFLWAPVVFAVPVLVGAFARWLTTGRAI